MELVQRIALLEKLGHYLKSDDEKLDAVKTQAEQQNLWFAREFINLAINNICEQYLDAEKLNNWTAQYQVPHQNAHPKKLGIVMAGNIPLVGFHDFLCGFITGQQLIIKPASKDKVLITHVVETLAGWDATINEQVQFAEQLKGCDAYIATGSNNTGRYFEYYFRNYASIIRKNRSSAAILTGNESDDQLKDLADDMLLYFGLGCRNVSKIYVPEGYGFEPLLAAFEHYRWMADHAKFKNNYDYNLSLHLLNSKYFMTNGIILLVENPSLFSPISQVHYEFYQENPGNTLLAQFEEEIQCLVPGKDGSFGEAQSPSLTDYADGVDTMAFLKGL